ncbi:MAG: PPE domain-containing protein [Dermatophilaceae bacterium]
MTTTTNDTTGQQQDAGTAADTGWQPPTGEEVKAEALQQVARTDFSAMDDQTILAYIHAGMPELLTQVGSAWSDLGVSLAERATDLEVEFRRLEPTWTGDSADQYAESVRSLIEATTVVGTMSSDLGEIVHSSASALAQVCAMYPAIAEAAPNGDTDGGAG